MKRRLTYLAAVAVVAAGSATAPGAFAAQVAAGPHWIVQPTPNRAVPSNMLDGVSCTSGAFCMAVGLSGPLIVTSASGRPFAAMAKRFPATGPTTRTLAERWNGTQWRIEPTPNPAGSSTTMLNGITCSSRRACTAVGSAVAGKITVPLVERWNGSRWSIVKTPHPPGAIGSDLQGVSCPASNECIAVGGESISSTVSLGFAERWNGSRWTLAGEFRVGAHAFLLSVSCSSATRCTAVGGHVVNTTFLPLAERWASGVWRRQATPGKGALLSVSCPAISDCTAVGSQTNQPNQPTLAMQWNGSRWKTQSAPEPPHSTNALLKGVSCTAVTSCEAVGSALQSTDVTVTVTIADLWNGKSWTLEPTPALTGTLVHQFAGVWCGAHVACRAAGSVEMPSFDVQTLVERR